MYIYRCVYINICPYVHTCIYICVYIYIEGPSPDAANLNPEPVTPPRPTPGDVGASPKPTT